MLSNMKILLGLLLVIAVGAFWVLQDNQPAPEEQPLIAAWQADDQAMAGIDKVTISQAGSSIQLDKNNDKWILNGGFYASIEPLFNLMQSFKNAIIVEAKTANPDNHVQVQLADDDLKVEFWRGEQLLQAVHVGKQSAAGLTFVRRAGENQTYTVKGLEPITFNEDSWQLKTVIDVPGDQVSSLVLKPSQGDFINLERDAESGQWFISNLPEGQQLKADANLAQLGNGLSRLMIDGALPLDLTDKEEQLSATYQLDQGQTIAIKVYQQEEAYFLLIQADDYPEYADWMMEIASYKFNALNHQLSEFIEPIVNQDEAASQSEEPPVE